MEDPSAPSPKGQQAKLGGSIYIVRTRAVEDLGDVGGWMLEVGGSTKRLRLGLKTIPERITSELGWIIYIVRRASGRSGRRWRLEAAGGKVEVKRGC